MIYRVYTSNGITLALVKKIENALKLVEYFLDKNKKDDNDVLYQEIMEDDDVDKIINALSDMEEKNLL